MFCHRYADRCTYNNTRQIALARTSTQNLNVMWHCIIRSVVHESCHDSDLKNVYKRKGVSIQGNRGSGYKGTTCDLVIIFRQRRESYFEEFGI